MTCDRALLCAVLAAGLAACDERVRPDPGADDDGDPGAGGAPDDAGTGGTDGEPLGVALPARLAQSPGPVVPVATTEALRRALAAATPGQIIELAAGTYGGFEIAVDGTAVAPITVRAAAGVRPRITGICGFVASTMIHLRGADFVRVQGLEVVGPTDPACPGYAMRVEGGGHVEIVDNDLHGHVGMGILAAHNYEADPLDSPWIIGNRIHDNLAGSRVHLDHPIYLSANTNDDVIANNVIYNHTGFGIHIYSSGDRHLVVNNTVDSVDRGGIIIDSAHSARIHNNVVSNGNRAGDASWARGIEVSGGSSAVVEHNVCAGFPGGCSHGDGQVSDLREADPRYRDRAARDYRPGPGSPAIDFALADYAPAVDFAGERRSRPADAGALDAAGDQR